MRVDDHALSNGVLLTYLGTYLISILKPAGGSNFFCKMKLQKSISIEQYLHKILVIIIVLSACLSLYYVYLYTNILGR